MNLPASTHQACPSCQSAVGPDDKFCESCGASLLDPLPPPPLDAAAAVSNLRTAETDRAGTAAARRSVVAGPCRDCGSSQSEDGYCAQCGARSPDGTDHFEADLGAAVLVSDLGLVHSRNEDAVAVAVLTASGTTTSEVAAVVCDGISTVSRPQEASLAAVEAALDEFLRGLAAGTSAADNHLAAAAKAVQAVAALDNRGEADPPACTYVAATITGTELVVSWIGDSRAYWLSPEPSEPAGSARLTEDDSWAGEMVRAGLLDQATAMRQPQAHAITRWIGSDTADDAKAIRPHLLTRPIEHPGVVLVCSDGLWNYLPQAQQLADVVFAADSRMAAARTLNQLSLAAGGDDNITLVLIEVPGPERTT